MGVFIAEIIIRIKILALKEVCSFFEHFFFKLDNSFNLTNFVTKRKMISLKAKKKKILSRTNCCRMLKKTHTEINLNFIFARNHHFIV